MKTLYHRIIFAACLLLFASSSFATNFKGIGLTLISDSIYNPDCSRSDSTQGGGGPGSPGQGSALTINAWLINFDSTAYSGPVDFGFYDTDSAFIQPATTISVTGIQGHQVTLGGNEKIAITININIPTQFRPGPDVVVVWPATLRPVADSVVINFLMPGELADQLASSTTGINDPQNSSFSYIVLQDKIQLVNLSAGLNFKQVRIFGMNGQQLLNERSNNITAISLPDMARGIYNCELLTTDNSRKVIRFVH